MNISIEQLRREEHQGDSNFRELQELRKLYSIKARQLETALNALWFYNKREGGTAAQALAEIESIEQGEV